MGDDIIVKQIFTKPIQLADQITKSVDDVQSFKQDCFELKSKTEKLASLLRQASQSSSDLYERPTLRIIENTERVLCKSLSLVQKCLRVNTLMKLFSTIIIIPAKCCLPANTSTGLMKLLFTIIIPPTTFKKMFAKLEILISDVTWLLIRDEYLVGLLPSIAQNEPILCLIWKQIDTLCKGSLDDRSDVASFVVSLARNNDSCYGKLFIQEGGVGPLLKLMEEDQEIAARAIGLLGRDPERVEHIIHAGVCDVFEKILKEGRPMKVQSMVAWAISELTANHPKCQVHFAHNNIIPLLVNHLVFEYGDVASKVSMTAMAAKALRRLAKGNSIICRSITECGGLLCFAVLLEKCTDDQVQYNSVMALTQIAVVAEEDTELRLSAFNPNTPAAKAVFDQLLRIIEQADSNNLIPCIMAMGYLARGFQTTETRIIGTLVKLLDDQEPEVSRAAAFALSKFTCTECSNPSVVYFEIIYEGGTENLIQIVYFEEAFVQIPALIVLSYMALHLPDSEELAQAKILTLLEWASKQECMIRDPTVDTLLPEAKRRLELYLSAQRYMIH